MSESNKPFTVKDRRHFTPEGRVREERETAAGREGPADEVPSAAAPPEEKAEQSPVEPEGQPPPSPPPAGAEVDGESSAAGPRSEAHGAQDADPADFGQFLFSLGAQAGMLLGGQGLPEGADPGEALAGARSIISILEMLKEKTEGRRTAQEDEILEGLLFELRMAYVEKSREGGS